MKPSPSDQAPPTQRAGINQLTNGITLPNRSCIVQRRRKSRNIVALVPRGGIEPSPIQLKIHHFLNGDFPVYLPVDPALSWRAARCDSVPAYPSRVRVTRYTKDIISAVCCALIQIDPVIKVQSPHVRIVWGAPFHDRARYHALSHGGARVTNDSGVVRLARA